MEAQNNTGFNVFMVEKMKELKEQGVGGVGGVGGMMLQAGAMWKQLKEEAGVESDSESSESDYESESDSMNGQAQNNTGFNVFMAEKMKELKEQQGGGGMMLQAGAMWKQLKEEAGVESESESESDE